MIKPKGLWYKVLTTCFGTLDCNERDCTGGHGCFCLESCFDSSLDCSTFCTSLILPPFGATYISTKYQVGTFM